MTQRADCGTVDGWKRHQQRRETICTGCATARDEYLGKVGQMRGGRKPRRVQRWERAREALLTPRPADCGLSRREWEVAVLALRGLGNGEIATELSLGLDTVKTHMAKILERLEIPNRTHLAILAYRKGWLPADLAQDADQVAVPRELFLALARLAHLLRYDRTAEARDLAVRLAPQLPAPRTQTP